LLFVAAIGLGATLGCRAEKAAESPATAPPEQPPRLSELDALEHDLAIAEQRLNAQVDRKLAARGDGAALGGAGEDGDELPEQAPKKQREATSAPPWRDAEHATPCDLACRALASMKRSAESICSISGEADARCVQARTRITSAEERIRRAGCACRER
jgi:hypothetical protein